MASIAKYLHRIVVAGLASALSALAFVYASESDHALRIYFLDVGQGDSIYVRSPGGRDMLVDGGPGDAALRKLSEAMPWYDRRIDIVLETHPDADHIGGLPQILERYEIGAFLEPGVASENAIDDELARLRQEKGVPSLLARQDMVINFGDGSFFHILYPDVDVSEFETNAASIVGRLVFGSTSAMLTGDSPKSVEGRLVSSYGNGLRSDVLKAGHHGSRTSTGERFADAVSPRYAVISAGKDNRYGHPHREVMDMLKSFGAEILRTDESGTIRFSSYGAEFERK